MATEANEADAEADNAVEAIVTKEIEAIVIDEVIAVDATITKLKSNATTNRDIAEGRD